MTTRVLVVDDSGFFRRRVKEILDADAHLEVAGIAVNGKEAIDKVAELKPDVVTMDIEMPVMDGITAVRHIMKQHPVPILMFSSLTTEGAQATLDALDAGAVDFLPKRFEDISKDKDEAKRLLCARVRALGARGLRSRTQSAAAPAYKTGTATTVAATAAAVSSSAAVKVAPAATARPLWNAAKTKGSFSLLAIGTSTGGPVALQDVLTKLPSNFPVPIVLVQHMPSSFTAAFAQRLNTQCQITVKLAEEGDVLKPGVAYLAPGGQQMLLESKSGQVSIKINDALPEQTYKPCVDITFRSVANVYHGKVLAIVLTGMGADGREGARTLKQAGAKIWAQDEESCVVYGMPAAIVEAGLADNILPLDAVGKSIVDSI